MANKEFFLLFILGISTCVTSNVCPSSEDIPNCMCVWDGHMLALLCEGSTNGKSIEDYTKILLDNFDNKTSIKLSFERFTEESRLPSRVFEGLDVVDLAFLLNPKISKWADEEGGPAFVGLEDSLKKLTFIKAIHLERRGHGDPAKTPMSLGHLSELREVEFHENDIETFANDWFDNANTSIEILELTNCKTRYIGDRAFSSLTDLKRINLASNAFNVLYRTMFPNPANHLEEILLQDNGLEALPDDMFTNMPSLTRVEINNNHIWHIPESVWRPVWSRLTVLRLSLGRHKHGLHCGDEIEWIFSVRPPKKLYAVCELPEDLKGVKLMDLIEEKQDED